MTARISLNSNQSSKRKQLKGLSKVLNDRKIGIEIKPITQVTTETEISGWSIRLLGNIELAAQYKGWALSQFGIGHKLNGDRSSWQRNSRLDIEGDQISLRSYRAGHIAIIEITADQVKDTFLPLGLFCQWAIYYEEGKKSEVEWLIPYYVDCVRGGLPAVCNKAEKITEKQVTTAKIKSKDNLLAISGISATTISYYTYDEDAEDYDTDGYGEDQDYYYKNFERYGEKAKGKSVYIVELFAKSILGGVAKMLIQQDYLANDFVHQECDWMTEEEAGYQDRKCEGGSILEAPEQKPFAPSPIPNTIVTGYNQTPISTGKYQKTYMYKGELYRLELKPGILWREKMVEPKGFDKNGVPYGGRWIVFDFNTDTGGHNGKGTPGAQWVAISSEEAWPIEHYSEEVYGTAEEPSIPFPRPASSNIYPAYFTPHIVVNESGTEASFVMLYEYVRADINHKAELGQEIYNIIVSKLVTINLLTMERAKPDKCGHIGHGHFYPADLPVVKTKQPVSVETFQRKVWLAILMAHNLTGTVEWMYDGEYGPYGVRWQDYSCNGGAATVEDPGARGNLAGEGVYQVKLSDSSNKNYNLDTGNVGGVIAVDYIGDKQTIFGMEYRVSYKREYLHEILSDSTVGGDGGTHQCGFPGIGDSTDKQTIKDDREHTYEEMYVLDGQVIHTNKRVEAYHLDQYSTRPGGGSGDYTYEKNILEQEVTADGWKEYMPISIKDRLFLVGQKDNKFNTEVV